MVVGSILDAVDQALASGPLPSVTELARRANVANSRFAAYLLDLKDAGFIEDTSTLRITAEGRAYLAQYRQWNKIAARVDAPRAPTEDRSESEK